jgi:hypothetical protein
MSAEEVAELFGKVAVEYATASSEVRTYAIHKALAEVGYTAVDVVRARYWLRRGKPAGYSWDGVNGDGYAARAVARRPTR